MYRRKAQALSNHLRGQDRLTPNPNSKPLFQKRACVVQCTVYTNFHTPLYTPLLNLYANTLQYMYITTYTCAGPELSHLKGQLQFSKGHFYMHRGYLKFVLELCKGHHSKSTWHHDRCCGFCGLNLGLCGFVWPTLRGHIFQ